MSIRHFSKSLRLCIVYRYDPKLRLRIARYASLHGLSATATHFSRKLGQRVRTSTIHCMKLAYQDEIRKNRASGSSELLDALPHKKQGRPVLLGEKFDGMVQAYIRRVREAGGSISSQVVLAAARGILTSMDKTKLKEFGGHVALNRHWAHSLLSRMNFVQRKGTTAKARYSETAFAEKKSEFLNQLIQIVEMDEIPPELILNWDQTGIKLVPATGWTMEEQGATRVELAGLNDKRQITAVFCGNILGAFLPIQVIYQGKTGRCHPHFQFPEHWDITHSPKHWSTEETMLQYVQQIIVPFVEQMRDFLCEQKSAVVIMDNFKGQVTEKMIELMESHDIHMCLLPANTTDRLQPMDVAVNKPAKAFLKKKFQTWYAEQISAQLEGEADVDNVNIEPIDLSMAVMKEASASWLVEMWDYISDNPQFIVNGFLHAGISKELDGDNNDTFVSEVNDNTADASDEDEPDNAFVDLL